MDDDSTLARLLAAAGAPAHQDELDGEEAALAAFRQQLSARDPAGPWRSSSPGREFGYQGGRERGTRRWSRVIPASAAVAVLAAGFGVLGTQLAGTAGTSRQTGVSVTVPASLSASPSASRSQSPGQPTTVAPTRRPAPPARPTRSAVASPPSGASRTAGRSTSHGTGADSGKHPGAHGHGGGRNSGGDSNWNSNWNGNRNRNSRNGNHGQGQGHRG